MNNDFVGIDGALELSDQELMLIQGGGWLDDAWHWTKKAASDAAHAVASAATATYNAVTSNEGKKATGLIGTVLGIAAGIAALL
ncbi:MAG TPA: hypothetical protein VFS67_05985 [Polyangiaceae bacterium]|nr:hypothetical protein [Polyangiaceae bacterium]